MSHQQNPQSLIKIRRILSNVTHSSTDNFLSPIPFSISLIFCCGNLILHRKNKRKCKNTNFYHEKQQKNVKKGYVNRDLHCLL